MKKSSLLLFALIIFGMTVFGICPFFRIRLTAFLVLADSARSAKASLMGLCPIPQQGAALHQLSLAKAWTSPFGNPRSHALA